MSGYGPIEPLSGGDAAHKQALVELALVQVAESLCRSLGVDPETLADSTPPGPPREDALVPATARIEYHVHGHAGAHWCVVSTVGREEARCYARDEDLAMRLLWSVIGGVQP